MTEDESITYDSWAGSFFGGKSYKYLDVVDGKSYAGALKEGIFT